MPSLDSDAVLRIQLTATLALMTLLAVLIGCSAGVADRTADAEALAARIRELPGVVAATSDTAHSEAQAMVFFRLYVDVADSMTTDQAASVTTRFLHALSRGTFTGYRVELDLRQGWNVFAVDAGKLAITNPDQIVAQAGDWIALRREFPTGTVTMHATITHPGGQVPAQDAGHSDTAVLGLGGSSDYTAVGAAVRSLARHFPQLAEMDWTVDAGKDHPAEITTSRRLPTNAELDVFARLNEDQTIPHIDRLRINGPVTVPVWFSEKMTDSHDVRRALELARAHLPVVAELPAPVLYSASDQISGHIGGRGFARGPVVVTVGGCTRHDPLVYLPIPAERTLIKEYETCAT